jgi:hypothetical protein
MKGLEAAAAQRQKRSGGAFLAAGISCQAAARSTKYKQGVADGRNQVPPSAPKSPSLKAKKR